jgi:GntR family transcriptional repressor for pyruvate dehydrogenase complex
MSASVIRTATDTTDKIVGQIVDLIQQQELQVGDQLPPIRKLSKLLAQNVTAVRDALLRAQAQGLVKVLPRAGAFVQKTSLKPDQLKLDNLAADFGAVLSSDDHNLFHLLDARRVIEMELGLRAIRRRDIEDLLPSRQTLEAMSSIPALERRSDYVDLDIQFHLQLAGLGGNPVLVLLLETILQRLRPCLERLPWDEERRRETDRMHAELYRALVDADEEMFCQEMREHQNSAYDRLLSQIRTPPPVPDA